MWVAKKNYKTTSGSVNGNNTTNSNIIPSTATYFYAYFTISKNEDCVAGALQNTNYTAQAQFFKAAFTATYMPPYATVDSVKLNNVPMMFITDSMYYDTLGMMTGGSTINAPYTIKVVGANGIPSFTYVENNTYPSYTGYVALPDTIYKSIGTTFTVTGVTKAGELNFYLQGNGNASISKPYANIPGSISISVSDLTQFTAATNVQLQLTFTKTDVENIYGKPMVFNTAYSVSKMVYIK